jgi:hypothetical protein
MKTFPPKCSGSPFPLRRNGAESFFGIQPTDTSIAKPEMDVNRFTLTFCPIHDYVFDDYKED